MLRVGDVTDVVAGLFAIGRSGPLGVDLTDDGFPVLDDLGGMAVDVHPRQRFSKNSTMHERTLHTRMRAEIAQAPLQHQRLPQPFDVAPRERQLAELQGRRFSRLAMP